MVADASSKINEQQKLDNNLYSTKQVSPINGKQYLNEFFQVNTPKLNTMEKQISENYFKIEEVPNVLNSYQIKNPQGAMASQQFLINSFGQIYKTSCMTIKSFKHR